MGLIPRSAKTEYGKPTLMRIPSFEKILIKKRGRISRLDAITIEEIATLFSFWNGRVCSLIFLFLFRFVARCNNQPPVFILLLYTLVTPVLLEQLQNQVQPCFLRTPFLFLLRPLNRQFKRRRRRSRQRLHHRCPLLVPRRKIPVCLLLATRQKTRTKMASPNESE